MDLKPSDRLDLRVFAIASRLKEVSEEISQARGEAYEIRKRIEEIAVSSMLTGEKSEENVDSLQNKLSERETLAERQEQEEIRLKDVLRSARRDHLRQVIKEKSRRWIILE